MELIVFFLFMRTLLDSLRSPPTPGNAPAPPRTDPNTNPRPARERRTLRANEYGELE